MTIIDQLYFNSKLRGTNTDAGQLKMHGVKFQKVGSLLYSQYISPKRR
jgi:hypothetical protein